MAYPTVNAPYGLKPINLYGGTPFAGATRQYQIASAYNTSIFYGDVVEMINDGTIIKSAITTARATVTTSQVIGVFLGCSYVNAQGQTIFAQYFPANQSLLVGTDVKRPLFRTTSSKKHRTRAIQFRVSYPRR